MVKTVWNHVRSTFKQIVFEAMMQRRQFRPMDPGIVMVFEVKTYIEHREVKKVR